MVNNILFYFECKEKYICQNFKVVYCLSLGYIFYLSLSPYSLKSSFHNTINSSIKLLHGPKELKCHLSRQDIIRLNDQ